PTGAADASHCSKPPLVRRFSASTLQSGSRKIAIKSPLKYCIIFSPLRWRCCAHTTLVELFYFSFIVWEPVAMGLDQVVAEIPDLIESQFAGGVWVEHGG